MKNRFALILALIAVFLSLNAVVLAGDPSQDEPQPTWVPPISTTGEKQLTYINDLQGTILDPPRTVQDFTLPSTTGEDFTFSDYGGKLMLVYFGYMTCPDVCPTTLADMMRAYREIGEPEDVQVVFISIDPERDTLDRMAKYVGAFHLNFIGVRPESEAQVQALTQDFGVTYQRREVDSAVEYLMDHSATVFLVGPDGRILTQYPFGVAYTEMAHDLDVLKNFLLAPEAYILPEEQEITSDPQREFRIVIPAGTGDQISMGQDPGVIPLKIELTLGEKDVLVLENQDHADFLVGGIWVAPHETVRKQFYEPQTFIGLCTVTVGRDLVEITISEPE
jgi:protein SCO1